MGIVRISKVSNAPLAQFREHIKRLMIKKKTQFEVNRIKKFAKERKRLEQELHNIDGNAEIDEKSRISQHLSHFTNNGRKESGTESPLDIIRCKLILTFV